MGLFGMLNKASGYSEEGMVKHLNEILPAISSKALCSVGVSLKAKTLFSSKSIASGFAAITDTSILVVYTIIPFKSAALYDFNSPKKLIIKNHIANQKIIEGKLFNIHTKEFDDLVLQVAPKIDAFPHQESELEYFLSILGSHTTEV